MNKKAKKGVVDMKFKKSWLGLSLAAAMMFTFFGSGATVTADSNGIDYQTPLTEMHEMMIIDNSAKNVNSVVTRSAFLQSVVASEGLRTAAANSKGSTPFSDIKAGSNLSGYINAGLNIGTKQGVSQGVVYGTADGTYRPNNAVTYAEACTVLVRLLGYSDSDSELANASWPNNYIQEAAALNLTTGISLNKNSSLTVGVEAVLFDRLFNTTMKPVTGSTSKYFSDNYYGDTTVTGTLTEVIVLGNSKTSDGLSDNQILAYTQSTGKETLTLATGVTAPTIGGKYKLYIDNGTVTKAYTKENTLEDYSVQTISTNAKQITYLDSSNKAKALTLPQASAYYYHGKFIDYATAIKSIQCYSSIILAKNSSGSGYEYGIIADPCYSQPYVYKYDNVELLNKLKSTKYDYMYREVSDFTTKVGNITESDLNQYDVVYFVSDIFGQHTFVYVYNKVVYGTISSFAGGKVNPTGVTLGTSSTVYSFSPYFDKTKLTNYDGATGNWVTNTGIGDFRAFVFGVDDQIVDIYTP